MKMPVFLADYIAIPVYLIAADTGRVARLLPDEDVVLNSLAMEKFSLVW